MKDKFNDFLEPFEKFLQRECAVREPENLYAPVNYVLSLEGKRVRPLLSILTYYLFDDTVEKIYPQAASIEMFHNFTLVHDDIMDQAPLRRGQATVHQKYNLNHAILSGDAMLIMAYRLLTRGLGPETLGRTLQVFTDAALKICEGQQYDMDFERSTGVLQQDYLKMIELKTAVLLGASMAIGGIRAGCSVPMQENLWHCGVAMGLAFQIQDDLLDVFGQKTSTGKQLGGDIIQRKQTIVWLKALELSGPRQEAELRALYNQENIAPDDLVRQVTMIYQSLGVERHCQALKERYVLQGVELIDAIDVDDERKTYLVQLLKFLLNRTS